ncbi:hypothetical protein ACFLU6_05845 [Acidobacteriota bacterium]
MGYLELIVIIPQPGLLTKKLRAAAEEEIAGIAIYLLLLCADQEVDLRKAKERKLTKNDDNYPEITPRIPACYSLG